MLKKSLFSLAALLFINSSIHASQSPAEACESKLSNFDKYIACIKNELSSRDDILFVGSQIVPLAQNKSGADFYNYIDTAFQKAMLSIKGKAIAENGLRHVSSAIIATVDRTQDTEKLKEELENEAKAELKAMKREQSYEEIVDGVLNRIKTIIDPNLDMKNYSQEQKEQAKAIAKGAIFSDTFASNIKQNGSGLAQGLVTYMSVVDTDKDGNSRLGVVAYVSDRSIQLYNSLTKGIEIPEPENKKSCKKISDIVKVISDAERLGKVGTMFYWDENCRPALLSFSIKSYKQKPALKYQLQETNTEKSEMIAQDNLAQFLGSYVDLQRNYVAEMKTIQNAMFTVIEGAIDNGVYEEGAVENSISSAFSKVVTTHSKVDTKGMKTVEQWYQDLGDVGVVGSMVSYSLSNILQVDKKNEKINAVKTGQKVSTNKDSKPIKVQKSMQVYNNQVTDDF